MHYIYIYIYILLKGIIYTRYFSKNFGVGDSCNPRLLIYIRLCSITSNLVAYA